MASSYGCETNVERDEFERLKAHVGELDKRIDTTRVILHGERGDNGLKSSIDRAHKAIKDIGQSVKEAQDLAARLALESEQGDRKMEVMVLTELRTLREQEHKREELARRWRIGQTVTIIFGVLGVLLSL
jgi:hypothetical protein